MLLTLMFCVCSPHFRPRTPTEDPEAPGGLPCSTLFGAPGLPGGALSSVGGGLSPTLSQTSDFYIESFASHQEALLQVSFVCLPVQIYPGLPGPKNLKFGF